MFPVQYRTALADGVGVVTFPGSVLQNVTRDAQLAFGGIGPQGKHIFAMKNNIHLRVDVIIRYRLLSLERGQWLISQLIRNSFMWERVGRTIKTYRFKDNFNV